MAFGYSLNCNKAYPFHSRLFYKNSTNDVIQSISSLAFCKSSHFSRVKRTRNYRILCSRKSGRNVLEADAITGNGDLGSIDKEESVTEFRMSDFELCNHVSVGLAGKGDELVFEAIVKKSDSSLNNARVVLRKLKGPIAQRRGRRALEVLKKLARRQFMYQLYATEIYGYILPSTADDNCSFTLVHGHYGSYSLHHWLLRRDWLPALEAKLALDEDCARRVGDHTIGGPAVSRQLRIIRMLLRDLLIGVNYLHAHGLAHTELRLENVHISCADRHVKVGILGNASDLHHGDFKDRTIDIKDDRRKRMIAFDVRCVGFMMAKMVLPELMVPSVFKKFKHFLTKENNPSCLREFLLPIINQKSTTGSIGVPTAWMLCGIHFLCGPRWPVEPSIDILRWGLGSTVVRIVEEYIYGSQQRKRLDYFIDLMERMNPNSNLKTWNDLLPGNWRLLYSTGRHIGLTLRQASPTVMIRNAILRFQPIENKNCKLSMTSDIAFSVMVDRYWPHNKAGKMGRLQVQSISELAAGERIYQIESETTPPPLERKENAIEIDESSLTPSQMSMARKVYKYGKWRKVSEFLPKQDPRSLPVVRLDSSDVEMTLNLNHATKDTSFAAKVLREIQIQTPPEMFDISRIVCGTFIDSRLLILRGVAGSALVLTRTFPRVI